MKMTGPSSQLNGYGTGAEVQLASEHCDAARWVLAPPHARTRLG
jgi:hypothetical protein